MTRNTRILLSCVYWAFVLYIFVPLILMVVMGFKDSKFIGFPIKSWTLDWYLGVFEDAEVLSVFGYSVAIAVMSTVIAIIVGVWLAVLLEGRNFWGRAVVFGLAILPALVPGIISAIAFRIYARLLGIEPGMFAIIWAHAVHNVPFVLLVVMARLSTLPVLIFAKLRSGMSPEINAIATVALVLTAALGVWAERYMRRMKKETGK